MTNKIDLNDEKLYSTKLRKPIILCSLCKKEVFKGYYERVGGIDKYYHESCKKSSIKQFFDEVL